MKYLLTFQGEEEEVVVVLVVVLMFYARWRKEEKMEVLHDH